ncbi:MAG TPA: phosphate ABC transporter permease PstA [Phycisphaerales bacterium]|nr:phosphate ABC transporter permease PstA [Phycisphaerales bacterium]
MSVIGATSLSGKRGGESRFALRRIRSSGMFWACCASTMAVITLLFLVAGYLFVLGLPGISWALFTQDATGDPEAPGGLRHAIVGTLVLIALSGVVGVPVGLLAGVYLSEYSREGRGVPARATRFVSDVLAGVPSIVTGILGYELLVVPMGHYNGWAGALALAFIMVPIVARTTEEMLRLVPDSFRAGSLALGATRSQTILRVVAPAATGSLVTGVMLAIARVAGETAPLLFTALGNRALTWDPSQPFPSLTKQVFDYVTGPYESQKRVGWAGILVLIAILLVLNVSVRIVAARAVRSRT